MSAMRKGFLLAAIHFALVLSLAAKLLYDRATRPRVWALVESYDPDLPIRGRYLSERLRMPAEGFSYKQSSQPNANDWFLNREWAHLEIRDGQLIAGQQGDGPGEWMHLRKNVDGSLIAVSEEPVLVFISEKAQIPGPKPGQETWVEVTLPAQGPPRPIRMGIKKDGVLTPLKLE
jgi:hypothetical protein